jgi:hypothetical protein
MVATLSDPPQAAPRRAFGGIVVAVLYTAFVLAAPLLVRYGPDVEVTSASVARVAIHQIAAPRCAYAPEFGKSCPAKDDDLR